MNDASELRDVKSHFAFGRNWESYAALIDEARIEAAVTDLKRLLPESEITGRRFLDIGCGSGLHALSAIQMGASEVIACDIDPDSVRTTCTVLEEHAGRAGWRVRELSVFDLETSELGAFDIVYSWGVLHHTGEMDAAIEAAAAQVAPNGLFAFALYRRTWLDGFWRREKRWYARHASPAAQKAARAAYHAVYSTASLVTGRRAGGGRGMEYWHDLHDWLGGYPYESILAGEVEARMRSLGFTPERVFARPRALGIFGSGCDEYVYRAPGGA